MKEKDKELKMEAVKIKELMNSGSDLNRKKIIKKDFGLLLSLASAGSPNRHLQSMNSISSENLKKLEM